MLFAASLGVEEYRVDLGSCICKYGVITRIQFVFMSSACQFMRTGTRSFPSGSALPSTVAIWVSVSGIRCLLVQRHLQRIIRVECEYFYSLSTNVLLPVSTKDILPPLAHIQNDCSVSFFIPLIQSFCVVCCQPWG